MTEVGRITIINTAGVSGSATNGDVFIVYHNGTTISVEKNGSPVSSGPTILSGAIQAGYVEVVKSGYTYCDGTTLIYFVEQSFFPYAQQRQSTNSPSCPVDPETPVISDLVKYGTPQITPSTGGADGAVTLFAQGTGTIKWGQGDFNYDVAGTEGTVSGGVSYYTFSNLYPGGWTFYAKDENGGSLSYNVTITTDISADPEDGGYGEKYYFEFYNRDSELYRFKLLQKGYDGSSTEITYTGPNPVTLNYEGQEDKFHPRLACSMVVELIATTSQQWASDFNSTSEREWLGELYKDPSGSNDLIQKGWLIPGLYTEPYEPAPYPISLTFTDGLADLKNEKYFNFQDDPKIGEGKIIDILANCLNKTGLEFGIRCGINLFEGDHDRADSDDPFDQTYIDQSNFYIYKDVDPVELGLFPGSNKFLTSVEEKESQTCSEIIGDILETFGARIYSYGGYWYIEGIIEKSQIYKVDFDSGTGTFAGSGTSFLSFGGGGSAELITADDNGATGTLYFKMISGDVPADNESITQGAATGDVNGTPTVSYPYREFDTDGSYSSNSFISPLFDFKVASQGTRIVREFGANTLSYDDVYKEIRLVESRNITESLFPTFSSENLLQGFEPPIIVGGIPQYKFSGYEGWNLVLNGDSGGAESGRDVDGKYYYSFKFGDDQGCDAYLMRKQSIQYTGNDSFIIKFLAYHNPNPSLISDTQGFPPYVKVRYMVKVGSKYLKSDGTWTTTATVVEYFLSTFRGYEEISISGRFDETVTTRTDADIEFRIYDCDPFYYDITADDATLSTAIAALKSAITAVDTTNLRDGHRLITRMFVGVSDELFYKYYELGTTDNSASGTNIVASDDSDRKWFKVADIKIEATEPSIWRIADLTFETLPSESKINPIREVKYTVSDASLSYQKNLKYFDVSQETNAKHLIRNYLKESDGTPTNSWGTGRKIQAILGEEMAKQYKFPARRIDFSGISDTDIEPFRTLREPNDDNRLYQFNRLSVNLKSRQYSGEIVQVGQDTAVEVRAHSSGHSLGHS